MDGNSRVRARKRQVALKLTHIVIRPGDRGHSVEEHREGDSEHFTSPTLHSFGDSPEESKRMVSHVVKSLGLPLDVDDEDGEDSEDRKNEDESEE